MTLSKLLFLVAFLYIVSSSVSTPHHDCAKPALIPRGGSIASQTDVASLIPASASTFSFIPRGGSSDPPSPPSTDPRVAQTIETVRSAASLLHLKGASAYPTLRDPPFRSGEVYVFIYDLNCNVLFNAASPSKEGHNTHGLTDSNGFKFHDSLGERLATSEACRAQF